MLRFKQWAKNLLIFIPLLVEFQYLSSSIIIKTVSVFVVFCFVASFIYIINDWIDRHDDALHPEKKERPFASRKLNGLHAFISIAILFLFILFGIFMIDVIAFTIIVVVYILQSIAYSLYLKNITLLEMFIVASGYTYRILIGAIAISSMPSVWILFTVSSAALMIVAVKRKLDLSIKNKPKRLSHSAYSNGFLNLVIGVMAATTISAYALFTLSEYSIQKFDTNLLSLSSIFVMYGVVRYCHLSFLPGSSSDPIKLTFNDKHLSIVLFSWVIFIISITSL